MPTDLSLRFRVVLALVGAVLLLGTSVVLLNYGLGAFNGDYSLTAKFDKTVSGLDTTSDVKLRGVTVGRVGKISLLPDGKVEVKLQLHASARIAVTTTASVEPLSIFGPGYVNLLPGGDETTGPFLHHNGSVRHTSVSTSFSNLLSDLGDKLIALDTVDLQTVVHTLAQGVAGLGPQFGQLLDNASTLVDIGLRHVPQVQEFLTDLTALSQTLVTHSTSLTSTISGLNGALPTLTTRGDALGQLLDSASQISGRLSSYITDHSEAFGTFVNAASGVLAVAYGQLANFPQVFGLVNEFVGLLANSMRLPAPGNTLVGALHGGVVNTLCVNIPVNLPVLCSNPALK